MSLLFHNQILFEIGAMEGNFQNLVKYKIFRVTFRFCKMLNYLKKKPQNFKTYQWYKQELQKVLQPKQQRKWQYISMNIFWQNFSPQNAVNGYVEEVLTKYYPANYFAWAEMGYLTWCTEGCSWKKKIRNISKKHKIFNRLWQVYLFYVCNWNTDMNTFSCLELT